MALIQCPDCGRRVSDRAQACPGCGYPIADRLGAGVSTPGDPPPVVADEGATDRPPSGAPRPDRAVDEPATGQQQNGPAARPSAAAGASPLLAEVRDRAERSRAERRRRRRRRYVAVAVVLAGATVAVLAVLQSNTEPSEPIVLPPATSTTTSAAPTTTADPRYWCPGLGYCDYAEPSRDPWWPRTYTGRIVSDERRNEDLPLTLNIHVVAAAYDLLVEGDWACQPAPGSDVCFTGDHGAVPEWLEDPEWTDRYGFPIDYPDPDEYGFLKCDYLRELRGALYVRIGVNCNLYLPYAYGRRDVRSEDGSGVFNDPSPLLVLEDTIDYSDPARDLPGAEFHIERVEWTAGNGTVIQGSWCGEPEVCYTMRASA